MQIYLGIQCSGATLYIIILYYIAMYIIHNYYLSAILPFCSAQL